MIEIVSLMSSETRLDIYRNLKQTNQTRWTGQFVIEGDKVVERLLRSKLETVSVVVGRSWLADFAPLVPAEVPLLVLEDDEVRELVGYDFHRGVLACGRAPANVELSELFPPTQAESTIVVCPEVYGPDNLGNLLRTSAALGISGVLLSTQSANPFSRRVLRVSMGESFTLPVRVSRDLAADLRTLAEVGFERVATVVDPAAIPLDRFNRQPRTAVLFGPEGHGLSEDWLAYCDQRVTIPMHGRVDSLNVAIAAGICLYVLTSTRP